MLVLDEPTEGLDPAAADAVLASALAATPAGHTVLLISHRLSGLAELDEIVVLDAGRVVQRGRHAELVAATRLVPGAVAAPGGGGTRLPGADPLTRSAPGNPPTRRAVAGWQGGCSCGGTTTCSWRSRLRELAGRLHGPVRLKADLLTEARHALLDATEAYREGGLPAAEAERRAVAEFGSARPARAGLPGRAGGRGAASAGRAGAGGGGGR